MNEVTKIEGAVATIEPAAITPMQMLQIAVSQGADIAKIEQLMALQERWEANQARKAFVAAMAQFKSEPISVGKDGKVDFTNKAGQRTSYSHATLAAVVDAVVSRMGKFGLSHKWQTEQVDGGVTVTCIITHELGHSESCQLTGPKDDSGNKNILQQIASTITYLQRYTLMSLCGLASKDMRDDDGRSSGADCISNDQLAEIEDLLTQSKRSRVRFMEWLNVDDLGDIPASSYNKAKNQLLDAISKNNAVPK